MKLQELSYDEMMNIDGGRRPRGTIRDRSSGGSWKKQCERDWGRVAGGVGMGLAGGVALAGSIFDDGNERRINYIREDAKDTIKIGSEMIQNGSKCKK